MTQARIDSIRARAERICGDSYSESAGYSGRGMCGAEAPLAFTTYHAPGSGTGVKLLGLSPSMRVDSMGCDYIYYLDTKID